MPRSMKRTGGLLVAVSMVLAGWSAADAGHAAPRAAAAVDRADAIRQLDAMGDSGSAGIPPAQARALTAAAEDDLTGDITFSTPSGTFQGQVSVQLSTAVAGAQIRYTTNGSLPTASSTVYQGALTFTGTTQLRAQAFVDGAASGAVGTALYVARAINATHDLPLVVIDSYNGGKPTKEDRDSAVMVLAPQNNVTTLAQAPAVATRAGFHLRGQSSSNFEKAPYRLEFHDNADEDVDYPVLGMPADSDWVLRGPFPDKSLVRDAFAYGMGRDMGLKAPRFSFVELYLNTDANPLASDDYRGVYLLVETIKRSPDRLDIQKLKKSELTEPAVSGGYILQFNLMASEPPTLTCTRRQPSDACWSDLEVVEPNDLQPEQQTWITNYVQKFHDSLRGANPSDPSTGYPAYIDVDSFVDRIIHNELAREGDSYMRSTHFYKDRGGKLTAGPLWDYDLAYDSVPMGGTSAVQGWQYAGFGGAFGTSDWFTKLMADPAFLAKVKTRWATLRQGIFSDAQMTARVNALAAVLTNAAARNFQRWPNLNTATVGGFRTQTTQTWQQQLTLLTTFLSQRAAWLSSTSGWGGGTVPVTPQPTTARPTTPAPTTPAPTTARPTTPAAGNGCTVAYTIANQWDSGFQADVKVSAGAAAIRGWTVTLTFANGQRVNQSWNATLATAGTTVTATNVSHNGSVAAGGSTSFGFIGSWSGTNSVPTASCTAT